MGFWKKCTRFAKFTLFFSVVVMHVLMEGLYETSLLLLSTKSHNYIYNFLRCYNFLHQLLNLFLFFLNKFLFKQFFLNRLLTHWQGIQNLPQHVHQVFTFSAKS